MEQMLFTIDILVIRLLHNSVASHTIDKIRLGAISDAFDKTSSGSLSNDPEGENVVKNSTFEAHVANRACSFLFNSFERPRIPRPFIFVER